jgi:hypothetical protein
MEAKLAVKFDNSEILSFVQGEDRKFQISFTDEITGKPIDLNLAKQIQVNLPRLGGGTVKRMMTGFLVPSASLTILTGLISYTDHGLVEDEIIRVSTTGTLPSGYLPATNYKISYIDENTFGLKDATTGILIKPSTQGSGGFTVTQQSSISIVALVDNAVLGEATLFVPAVVSSKTQDALAQNFQAQYVDSTDNLRIAVLTGKLDVTPQPTP